MDVFNIFNTYVCYMRIDLPLCNFKNCKWEADCNCTSKSDYDKCYYRLIEKTLKKVLICNDGCRSSCTHSYYVKGIGYDCDEEHCKNYSMYDIDWSKVIKDYNLNEENI